MPLSCPTRHWKAENLLVAVKEMERSEAWGKPSRSPRFDPGADPAMHHPDHQTDEQRGIAEKKRDHKDAGHQVRREPFTPPENLMCGETKRLAEPKLEIRGQARIPVSFHRRLEG